MKKVVENKMKKGFLLKIILGKIKKLFFYIFNINLNKDISSIKSQIQIINSTQQILLNRIAHLIEENTDKWRMEFAKDKINADRQLRVVDDIPIVFITDSKYVNPTFVSISSIINSSENVVSLIYVVCIDLSSDEILLFSNLSEHVKIIIYKNTKYDFGIGHRHVSSTALVKFDLAAIFSMYEKILYLDSDITVHGDLNQLLTINLEDKYVGVVKDLVGMLVGNHHVGIGVETYFNSGVMLINLKRWRDENVCDLLIHNKKNDSRKLFMDQDTFNVTFKGNVLFLNPTYNFMFSNMNQYSIAEETFADFYQMDLLSAKKIYRNPVVRHYSNIDKPWLTNKSAEYEIWLKQKVLAECIFHVKL